MRVGVGVGEEGLPWWLRRSKNLPAMRETRVQSLDGEDPLEKGMATHSSILAWRIPWTEESGSQQSTFINLLFLWIGRRRTGWPSLCSLGRHLVKVRAEAALSPGVQDSHASPQDCWQNSVPCGHRATSMQAQCQTLYNPMDCDPPGSSVQGILQARIREWVAMPSSRGSSRLLDQTCVSCGSCIASGFFTTEP